MGPDACAYACPYPGLPQECPEHFPYPLEGHVDVYVQVHEHGAIDDEVSLYRPSARGRAPPLNSRNNPPRLFRPALEVQENASVHEHGGDHLISFLYTISPKGKALT